MLISILLTSAYPWDHVRADTESLGSLCMTLKTEHWILTQCWLLIPEIFRLYKFHRIQHCTFLGPLQQTTVKWWSRSGEQFLRYAVNMHTFRQTFPYSESCRKAAADFLKKATKRMLDKTSLFRMQSNTQACSNLFRHRHIYLTWAKWQLSPQPFHFTRHQEKEGKKSELIKCGGEGEGGGSISPSDAVNQKRWVNK